MASNVPPHHIPLPSDLVVQPFDSARIGATDKLNDKFFYVN